MHWGVIDSLKDEICTISETEELIIELDLFQWFRIIREIGGFQK